MVTKPAKDSTENDQKLRNWPQTKAESRHICLPADQMIAVFETTCVHVLFILSIMSVQNFAVALPMLY